MKASELRKKSVEDLQKQLIDLRQEQFKLRMQKATGELAQTHIFKELRRDVARIKTLLSEKKA